jgi:hypothetical protein
VVVAAMVLTMTSVPNRLTTTDGARQLQIEPLKAAGRTGSVQLILKQRQLGCPGLGNKRYL